MNINSPDLCNPQIVIYLKNILTAFLWILLIRICLMKSNFVDIAGAFTATEDLLNKLLSKSQLFLNLNDGCDEFVFFSTLESEADDEEWSFW